MLNLNVLVERPVMLCADEALFPGPDTTFTIDLVYSTTSIMQVTVEVVRNNGVVYFNVLPTKSGIVYVQKDSTPIAVLKASKWGVDEAISKLLDNQLGSWEYDKKTGEMIQYTLTGQVLNKYDVIDNTTLAKKTLVS